MNRKKKKIKLCLLDWIYWLMRFFTLVLILIEPSFQMLQLLPRNLKIAIKNKIVPSTIALYLIEFRLKTLLQLQCIGTKVLNFVNKSWTNSISGFTTIEKPINKNISEKHVELVETIKTLSRYGCNKGSTVIGIRQSALYNFV